MPFGRVSKLSGSLQAATARVKVQTRWQTDVLTRFTLGTLSGYYAHSRGNPLILGLLPGGLTVGIHKQF
jgi:hypothetical protein